MRVTQTAMARSLLARIAEATARLARAQEEIASGRRLLRASDDPAAAAAAVSRRIGIAQIDQFLRNAERMLATLAAVDGALHEVTDILVSAKEVALGAANATASAADRESAAIEVDAMLDRLLQIGNTHDGNRFLFAGQRTRETPFAPAAGGAVYRGDSGEAPVRVDLYEEVPSLLPGARAFRAAPASLGGGADLDPDIWEFTPLADLHRGGGVALSRIEITDSDGNTAAVDLVGATTVKDVLDRVNAAGLAVSAEINAARNGIALRNLGSGATIAVSEVGDGVAAAGLGILGASSGDLVGEDLDAAVSESTPLALLRAGAGVSLGTIRIDHEVDGIVRSADVDLAFARTVGDVLVGLSRAATLEGGSLGVVAALDDGGAGVTVRSTIPGARLSIGDAAAPAGAAALGVAGSAAAPDLFAVLAGLRDALRADDRAGIEEAIALLDAGVTENLEARVEIGARVRRIESSRESLEARRVAAETELSAIEDVDLAEAIVRATREQAALEAALTASSRSISLSLMDFLR